jgi:hypothetical protein
MESGPSRQAQRRPAVAAGQLTIDDLTVDPRRGRRRDAGNSTGTAPGARAVGRQGPRRRRPPLRRRMTQPARCTFTSIRAAIQTARAPCRGDRQPGPVGRRAPGGTERGERRQAPAPAGSGQPGRAHRGGGQRHRQDVRSVLGRSRRLPVGRRDRLKVRSTTGRRLLHALESLGAV